MRSFTLDLIFGIALLGPVWADAQVDEATTSGVVWVQGGDLRLKGSVFAGRNVGASPVLLVVLHGDAPRSKPDYQDAFAAKAAPGSDVIAVGLLRPGYTDPQGHTSDGERGETTGDNYNARNTDAIAAAIAELKHRYHARKVVVAGHSGGAAITANILGRHPELIDAALLVSCPCDVEQWRASMLVMTGFAGFKGKIDTLSPIDLVGGLSKDVAVTMVVGSQDKVAPPLLSEQYQAAAARSGKAVQLVSLAGKEHDILLEPEVFGLLAPMLH